MKKAVDLPKRSRSRLVDVFSCTGEGAGSVVSFPCAASGLSVY